MDEARAALLGQARQAWGSATEVRDPGVDQAIGDVDAFLAAYYRRVATEDLAPPGRLAEVAQAHAAAGLIRPQGKALVSVSQSPFGRGLVVDIITDDMQYLVDSVTTELNRHRADIDVIVHPILTARRDVTGNLLGIRAGNGTPEPGEIRESWIHVEIERPGDRTAGPELAADLRRVLEDVRVAIEDQPKMLGTVGRLAAGLDAEDRLAEEAALLRWLADGHFTFLGYREYDLVRGPGGTGLRGVPGTGLGILRHDRQGPDSLSTLPQEAVARGTDPADRLVLAKANSRSTVYRANYLDYVSVKKLAPDGSVAGEYRFLGLYTYAAYAESVTHIPVLRRKVDQVLADGGMAPDTHDGKDLVEILQTYPREELFEIPAAELTPIALGVLRLRERRQTRLFLRRDSYGRYISCLIYLPRDRYTTGVRLRIQDILRDELGGASTDYSAMVGDSALARLHVVVRGAKGTPLLMPTSQQVSAIERQIAVAVRSWDEDVAAEASRLLDDEAARALLDQCAAAIPETYKADVPAAHAVEDLSTICRLRAEGTEFAVQLRTGTDRWALRVYRTGMPITLSDVLPQLQHMGLDVVDEHPYEFSATDDQPPFWIYEFGLKAASGSIETFEDAMIALWRGHTEDDGFNALVLAAGLNWREVTLLRAIARYLRQAGMRFSEEYMQRVLRANPSITRLLVRLFASRFDPARQDGVTERCEAITEELRGQLDEVMSLDHDRILRSYLALIDATLRTNYYQERGPEYLVLKLDPGSVPGLVSPRPKFEIYVYSPRFEAVHLRFGRVARGGLRWSDRLEDFRTEVLGLVKAQEVKNAVIVPSGAKGGFVCKRLPDPADRDAYQAEVLTCYQTFISAMLDVTDNIADNSVVPPRDLVRRDGDDPYLVVAADKGTATFSDSANQVAARYGFWLGDAFASGGSEGYDHKKMGITARGAWESVRAHFASLGLNPDTDEFTAVGVGDMSGDVFGNGMLLSDQMKLIAAFDHRHIFVDPAPSPSLSFGERRRLFDLPRSSWADYDPALISPGGGVWPRTVKSIPVTPQMRSALGLDASLLALSPDELISAILCAPVDLLWNGGIGTYVKSSAESNADVGDRSNDAVRVSATQLRARVIGEGGNLGLTQAGRVEFSIRDGLVNTDFIDNSAGVDTSDHE
ncbi:MAG TPA: NAD-glutamate dehydrogenase domain-containing protein, partial [Streptosporangiaceae bacterium]|nr:NAD-glutamate dehydrogenase domain-containing protein [Streptosporangiaceae bacterium]